MENKASIPTYILNSTRNFSFRPLIWAGSIDFHFPFKFYLQYEYVREDLRNLMFSWTYFRTKDYVPQLSVIILFKNWIPI